jgi:predicted nucleotidyltransferase
MIKIGEIKNIVSNVKEIEFAYLFGSFADGSYNESSDIDIAIYLDEKCNFFDTKLHIHHQLERKLHRDIDIIVLNNAKNFYLLKSIFECNILLQESSDDKRLMYELSKEHEIQDYIEFKKMLDVA